MDKFSDKAVLITGAGSGLGQATAVRLASERAKTSRSSTSTRPGSPIPSRRSSAARRARRRSVSRLTSPRNPTWCAYGQFGISITAIAPGAIMTPMIQASLKQIDPVNWEAVGQEFVSVNPMKRFGRAEEVAHLVAFLLSDDAEFINAAVIPIDGGQSYKY